MDLFCGTVDSGVVEKAIRYYPEIPDYTIKALYRYTQQKIRTGDFLYAVLSNNLSESFYLADGNNLRALHQIVKFCYNEIPDSCRGGEAKVKAWLRTE